MSLFVENTHYIQQLPHTNTTISTWAQLPYVAMMPLIQKLSKAIFKRVCQADLLRQGASESRAPRGKNLFTLSLKGRNAQDEPSGSFSLQDEGVVDIEQCFRKFH